MFAALAMMLSTALPAEAAAAAVWVVVYADQETQGVSYKPASQTASRAGISATVSRHGTGSYTVSVANASSPGLPVVTAVNNAGVHCQLSWYYQDDDGTTEIIEVACYTGATLTDSEFTLAFFTSTPPDGGGTGAYGYVHDDRPDMADHTPARSYNSTGGAVKIYHTAGTSIWTVRFFGQAFNNTAGNVQVSAVGTTPMRCAVYQWYPVPEVRAVDAQVRCDRLANPGYTPQWTLAYTHDRSIVGGTSGFYGYLQANDPAAPAYTPMLPRNRAPETYTHTVSRSGPGQYQAQIYGPLKELVAVHVSVNGNTDSFCNLRNWTVTPNAQPAARVNLTCYNANGVPADNWFSLNYYSP